MKMWQPVPALDGVWSAARVIDGVPLRSLAIRLADGRLAIHSPIRRLAREARGQLAEIGKPAFLIAPNHFHNRGLHKYLEAYPGVTIVASPTAVGDAFFNIARTPRTPIGFLLWLLGISAGLRIGASFRWLVRDRGAYRRWLLDAIAAQRPTTLIPCHGDVLTDPQLPDRLQRLVERRF